MGHLYVIPFTQDSRIIKAEILKDSEGILNVYSETVFAGDECS